MSRLVVLVGLVLSACTAHDSQGASGESGFLPDVRALAEATLDKAAEDRRAFEDRRRVREALRKRGFRVCEEGEHGTAWQEDCNSCQCENGMRACTRAMCKKHPRGQQVFDTRVDQLEHPGNPNQPKRKSPSSTNISG